jgi:hypothetical protein
MQSTARALIFVFVLYTMCLLPTQMFAGGAPRRTRANTASTQQL